MKIKENLWEAIETLGKYTDRHVLSMSRADYEAHLLAIRALNDYQFRKDLDAMGPQAEAEKAEEERLSALERQALVTEDEKREARRREESETALDEYETARLWAMSPPRYCVTLIVDEVAGLPNVEVHLFHESMPNDEMASLVVLAPDRDIEHVAKWYTGTAIEQTFSKAEVQQLHSYLKEFSYFRGMKVHRARCPDNNCMGYGAYPIGSHEGFHDFYKDKDYSLPFKVVGYYDTRPQLQAKIDKETVDIAEAIAKGKIAGCNGNIGDNG